MSTLKADLSCSICKELYQNPVVHRPCGISFDRECLGRLCPNVKCGEVIRDEDLTKNFSLLKIVDEYRFTLVTPAVYYLILLDTSTSMWYSDTFLPFALGESRLTYGIQFLEGFFKSKMHSMTDKISLYTFDTSPLQRFDFETIDGTHLTMLKDLECKGADTALFDSIDLSVDKLDKLQKILAEQMANSFVIVLTDGGNNFGKKESIHAQQISSRSKKLNIQGYMVQLGDRHRRKTRLICDALGYKFNHFRGGDLTDLVNSISSSMRVDVQSRAKTNEQTTRRLIAQLVSVPESTAEVKVPAQQKELA